jgi:hypothetical protein
MEAEAVEAAATGAASDRAAATGTAATEAAGVGAAASMNSDLEEPLNCAIIHLFLHIELSIFNMEPQFVIHNELSIYRFSNLGILKQTIEQSISKHSKVNKLSN